MSQNGIIHGQITLVPMGTKSQDFHWHRCKTEYVQIKTNYYKNDGNLIERSAIWSEIICVISKSKEPTVQVRFEIISTMISDQNCTTRGSIATYQIHFEIHFGCSVVLFHSHWLRKRYDLEQKSAICE